VSITPAIILFRFSGRAAEVRVMTKCIKFLTLGPMSTSTPSFQQLYSTQLKVYLPITENMEKHNSTTSNGRLPERP